MTNGADKHDDRGGKKKASEKPKQKDPKAALKKKNMLPKALAATRGQ